MGRLGSHPRPTPIPVPTHLSLAPPLARAGRRLPRHPKQAVGAFSHCWRTPSHPDPEGESLLLMADALEVCYREKEKEVFKYEEFPKEMGLFVDWCSLFQKDPSLFDAGETPEAKPEAVRAAFVEALQAGRATQRPKDVAQEERSLAAITLLLEHLVQLAPTLSYGDLQSCLPYSLCLASYAAVSGPVNLLHNDPGSTPAYSYSGKTENLDVSDSLNAPASGRMSMPSRMSAIGR